MAIDLPLLPQGIGQNPQQLVLALNDRLRRISAALSALSPAAAPATTPSATGTAATTSEGTPSAGFTAEYLKTGLRSARPTLTSAEAGFLYLATDATMIFRWTGSSWAYQSGMMTGVLSARPTPAATDAGFLFYATDTLHTYKWTGTAWTFAPGDAGASAGITQAQSTQSNSFAGDFVLNGTAALNVAGTTISRTVSSNGSNTTVGLNLLPTETSAAGTGLFNAMQITPAVAGAFAEVGVRTLVLEPPKLTGGATVGAMVAFYIPTQQITGVGSAYAIFQGGANDINLFSGPSTFSLAVTMTVALPIASGGTGAATAAAARTNLAAVSRTTAITAPSGGTTIDTQARTAIAAIIAALNS